MAKISSFRKFLELLKYEKSEISAIYFYAVLYGLVQLSVPLGIQSIISFVLGGAISTSLVLLIVFVIAGVFITGLLQVNQMKLIEKIQQQLFVRYSFQYADIIPNFNLRKVDGYYLPELVNRFFDTIPLQKSISKLLLDIPGATIQILFGLVLLSFYHPVFIIFGVSLLFILYLILRSTTGRGMETSILESDYKYMVLGYLEELARVVTSFKFSKNKTHHLTKTDEYVVGYLNARTAHFKVLLFQYWALIGFKVLITSAMLIVGAYLLIAQQLNIGQFIAAEIVILMIIGSVEKLILNLDKVYDVLTSVEKITKVTDKPTEKRGGLLLETTGGIAVEAHNLYFGYDGEETLINNVSFSIGKGEKIGIFGAPGSGKSTLLRLISGTYTDFGGNLLLEGVPVHSYDLYSLRSQTGIMLHQQEVFQGSILENICMGNQEITYKELDMLAEITGLKPFISTKKEGYEFQIQPAGQHLSSRIIKKILLMRALVSNPKLLLLEEPWTGIEPIYRERIQQYLLRQTPDTTVIVVTSDEEFTRRCDKIFFLENGTITPKKQQ
jgi:ABC-type bacteriocin/lantibiotic exporters, contain an N-terminal double-glycine peptidase domain